MFQVDFICSQVGFVERSVQFNISMIKVLDPFNVRCTYTTSVAYYPLWITDFDLCQQLLVLLIGHR